MTDSSSPEPFNVLAWLRNSFLTGVAVVLPFVVTIWVIWLVVSFIDINVSPLIPASIKPVTEQLPGAGLVLGVLALTLIGAATGNLIGQWLVDVTDRFIGNLPVIRSIYGGAKQVFKQVAAPERTSFKEAVLVEFPVPGSYAIGFVTNSDAAEIAHDTGEDLVAVFVPHAPLPTSGFLLYVQRSLLKPMLVPPEDALKRVLSLGIIRDADNAPPSMPK